jgi:hypothetical protein
MPHNDFPDSAEKRELRRRDRRLLLPRSVQLAHKLDYCGMPSKEFLDVRLWRDCLRSVVAIEVLAGVAEEMRVERDVLAFEFPVQIVEGDVRDYLLENGIPFDLYNLDFYGGFLNPSKNHDSRTIKALRALFATQAKASRSFALITTFNLREAGGKDYLAFLDAAKVELSGLPNGSKNLAAHEQNQATRLKLCFPFFCWQTASVLGFEQQCENVFLYTSSATMLHFHQWFDFQGHTLPSVRSTNALTRIANLPLFALTGLVPHKKFEPPAIGV